jgi:predicted nucleic acid-binding protein
LARSLIFKYPLRSLDAIQLASAIVARRVVKVNPVFLTADDRLLPIATSEGVTAINPSTQA